MHGGGTDCTAPALPGHPQDQSSRSGWGEAGLRDTQDALPVKRHGVHPPGPTLECSGVAGRKHWGTGDLSIRPSRVRQESRLSAWGGPSRCGGAYPSPPAASARCHRHPRLPRQERSQALPVFPPRPRLRVAPSPRPRTTHASPALEELAVPEGRKEGEAGTGAPANQAGAGQWSAQAVASSTTPRVREEVRTGKG